MSRGQLKIAAVQWPAQAEFWRRQLAGVTEPGCIPPDVTGPPGPVTPAQLVIQLDPDLAGQLSRLGRNQPQAMHAIAAAGLVALLARYTGSDEIVLGQPTMAGAAELNTELALRCSVEPADTFRDLLLRVRDTVLQALRHQDYPVQLLAEQRAHCFDVAASWTGVHEPRFADTVQAPLLFAFGGGGEHITVTVRYDAGRFHLATVQRAVEHLTVLLRQVLTEPQRPLAEVDLLTAADAELIARVNDTAAEYDTHVRIEELFDRQVAANPDALAVVGEGIELSYAELDRRANSLARTLRARGVGRDDLVAVLAQRSPQMLVAIYAILKAGGAYLPVDPGYPRERIEYVLADSHASLVLAQRQFVTELPAVSPVLDLDDPDTYDSCTGPLPRIGDSTDLAYVIYTSGSTGNPKGVMIEHHSVINRIGWMQKAYPIGPGDVILQKTPISFDVSVWELFWWAFQGATVCLLPPGGEKNPTTIIETAQRYQVSTLHFVPSMLAAFLAFAQQFAQPRQLDTLRLVFASGEALGEHQVRHFAELLPAARLVNLYGPTEATVDVSHYACTGHPDGRPVPIGRPIDNTRMYVLDQRGRVQPVGVPGELCLAGVGLARGYLQRPQLTAEKFLQQPFDQRPFDAEQRIYRTGDIARLLPSGEFEYLGRTDHQVKIRGFRIELGEIEQRLRAHVAVRDAVVVARNGGDGQAYLCGYVVTETATSEDELRRHVGQRLPEFMVPTRIVQLAQFPLSPNGKLDRRALPEPQRCTGPRHVPPRTDAEQTMAEIWRQVLGVDTVGVHDNFFTLGGNSIHFVTVLARARAAGMTFTFQQLFSHPTIAELLAVVPAGQPQPARAGHAPFELITEQDRATLGEDIEDAYPMSMLQVGLIFQSEITKGTAQYHDIISYLIGSHFDQECFARAVDILVSRNPIMRTSYHLTGFSQYLQLVHRQIPTPLRVHDLRHLDERAQQDWYEQWVRQLKRSQFTWGDIGLVTLHVQVLSEQQYRYNISLHNSALDGWSINLVHTQLFEIYYRLLQGREYTEPLPDNHLRDYIALELAALDSAPDRRFWAGVLAQRPFTEVPRWVPTQPDRPYSVVLRDVALPDGLSDQLIALAEQLSVPVKNVLLAAHVKVMGALAGQRDVLTGYEHAGRPEVQDADRAIGMFLNTVPLRLSLQPGSWAQLIREVYQAEIELLPHRRYPMARMKQDLGTQQPLFESVFNFTHFYSLKQLRELPEFALLDVRAESETEFVLRTEFSRHFFHDDVRLSLHYHAHLFDEEQIQRIAGYFVRALTLMVADPQAPHGQTLLGEDELRQQLRELATSAPARIQTNASDQDALVYLLDEDGLPVPLGGVGELTLSIPAPAAPALSTSTLATSALATSTLATSTLAADPYRAGRVLRRAGRHARWLPSAQPSGAHLRFVDRDPVAHVPAPRNPAAPRTPAVLGAGPRRTPTEARLAQAWAAVLGVGADQIGGADDFFGLGGNSLSALRVVMELDGLVALTDLMRYPRLDQLAELVDLGSRAPDGGLLQPLLVPAGEPVATLVCLPYAGGNAINFRPLATELATAVPGLAVHAVELPGHDPRRPDEPLLDVPTTAKEVVAELGERVRGPLLLWGHCVGSALAMEVARLLREAGADLRLVFLAGKLFPGVDALRANVAQVSSMTDGDIRDWLVDATGFAEFDELSGAQAVFLARLFRHDAASGNTYLADTHAQWAQRKLDVACVMVASADDAFTPDYQHAYLGWLDYVQDVRLVQLPDGGHYFAKTRPQATAAVLAQAWTEVAR